LPARHATHFQRRKTNAPKDDNGESGFNRKDVYTRVTDRIVADLEKASVRG